MFKLVIQDDEGKTTVVPLIRDEITIGRKEGNTIRLTERNVSRRHARIHRTNGSIAIEDLNSYNGIIVNGARIQGRVDLTESDRVQIGDYLIELKTERAAKAGAAAEAPQATQPMERVDPMGNTPVPEPMADVTSEAATRPVAVTSPTAPQPVQAPPPAAPPPTPVTPQALADTDPGLATAPQAIARMVVLSSNFAGKEFPLDKPACVIGRTDDNDIVIDHRSISRHHAKIVQEQGRFAVVDLQSSNGVRVNGEEYGKVELRRGDVVDLGHVRLRFVEAGEDFVLGRDAQIVDLAAEASGGGRSMLWAALGVLVIGGAIAALALRGGDDGNKDSESSAGSRIENKQPKNPVVADAPADAGQVIDDPGGDVGAHLNAAREALHAEEWANMQAAALEALAIDPTNEEAKRLKEQAKRELENELRFGTFRDAVAKKDYEKVKQTFEKIDRDSVYRLRAQNDYDRIKGEFVREVEADARKRADAANCKSLAKLAQRARRVWPEAGDAADNFMADCKRNTQVAAKDPPKKDPPKKDPPRKDPPKKDPPPSGLSADDAAAEASNAAKAGNYGRAYKLCEDALDVDANHPQARMVCTIASCKMKNSKRAKRHYGKLSASSKRAVKQLCASSGIVLE
jgi:pSer/pThr/pTyr-binding forkhead associated (FHA) protein